MQSNTPNPSQPKKAKQATKRLKKATKRVNKRGKTFNQNNRMIQPSTFDALTLSSTSRGLKKSQMQHLMNILDPWNAVNAKLPQIGESYSNSAKIHNYTTISTSGTSIWMYVDVNYVTRMESPVTTFSYLKTLTGSADPVASTYYYSGGISTVPAADPEIVDKYRVVSAAIRITPKLSLTNYTATAYSCVDYGDYPVNVPNTNGRIDGQVGGPNQMSAITDDFKRYFIFSNILSGNGGTLTHLSNMSQSIEYRWFPVDPLSDVYINPGDIIGGIAGVDIGGSPRFVCAFTDLPANTPIDVEFIWNVEYLPTGKAKPWLGYSPSSVSSTEHLSLKPRFETQANIQPQLVQRQIGNRLYATG